MSWRGSQSSGGLRRNTLNCGRHSSSNMPPLPKTVATINFKGVVEFVGIVEFVAISGTDSEAIEHITSLDGIDLGSFEPLSEFPSAFADDPGPVIR